MSERLAGVRFVVVLLIVGSLLASMAASASGPGPAASPRVRHASSNNILTRLNALSPTDRAKLKRQVLALGPSGSPVQDEARSFSVDRAQALVDRIEELPNLGAALADKGSAAKALSLLPAFKQNLSDFAVGKLSGDQVMSLEQQETELENLEGLALKGQHHAAAYRPDWPAPLPEGLAPSRNPEDWHSPEGISKVNTGWIFDQHMFDPDSPRTYPTLTSDFKHYDEGQNGMAMGHSDHPSADTMFGWVWQVQSFYWTDITTVPAHSAASYCLFIMVSGDGGSTWFLYNIIYDPSGKDMINPKMAMDVSTYTTSENTYDRFYIAYEYAYSSTDHDVYVYSDNSELKFYDGTSGGTSDAQDAGVGTTIYWEGNPTIASDYKTTETSYRVVAYEYATSATVHDIYASQSSGHTSATITWTAAVVVTDGSGMATHPALAAGCSGGSSFAAYMHLAYNYDTYTASGAQLLLNPGFESGTNGNWTVYSSGAYAVIENGTGYQHAGTWVAWLDGYTSANEFIYQQVTVPPGVLTSTFSFWIRIATNDSTTVPYDYFYADIRDTSGSGSNPGNLIQNLVTLSNADVGTYGSYTQLTFDLSAYRGRTFRIYFRGTNDARASTTTSFFVDDTAINDGVYNTDSEVRYARGQHSTANYPSDLAAFTKLTIFANTGGTTAWPYGSPAIAATYGGSTTITGGRVVIAADQFFPQDQPTTGDPARYQLNFAVSMCNGTGGTTCGNIPSTPPCSPAVPENWNWYYFYDNKNDYRFPSLVVDGVGWVQGTSTVPQNGVAYWPEIFMAYYIRDLKSSSPFGEAQMLVADASDERCEGFASGAWYLFTAALQATDNDGKVVAKPGTLITFNYFGGWPGLCFNKRLNHQGANVNDDVYFTTLGDNYTIDTISTTIPLGHILAWWKFNGVSYLGPWTYPWPAGIEWDLTADATEIADFRYYAFSAWSIGTATPLVAIISDWCYYGSTTCPVTSINALYGLGCLVSPPTVSNSVMVSRPGGIVTLGWNGPAQPADVGQYTIWRGTNPVTPSICPTLASQYSSIGSTANLSFQDTSAPDHLDCYIIVANCGPYSGPWGAYGQ